MNAYLIAIVAAASVSVLGCNQDKKEASPEPAATTATPATATPETPTTAKAGEESDKAGAAQPSTAEKTDKAGAANPDIKTPTTTVAKGEKEVKADGKDLNLKNESGKGSVKTNPGGGTTVTGKSGKSIAIPGL